MTFRNRSIRWAAALSAFVVLLAGGLAGAQKTPPSLPPPGMGKTNTQIVAERGIRDADSGKHHEVKKEEGPIVDTWKITQRKKLPGEEIIKNFGTASLTLNSDGSWNFSGQMNEHDAGTDCRFYIAMAVKSSEGTSVLFRQSDVLKHSNPESYSWQKQGNNRTIKDNFNAFEKSHDWAGHWTCVRLPKAGQGGPRDPNWEPVCQSFMQSLSLQHPCRVVPGVTKVPF